MPSNPSTGPELPRRNFIKQLGSVVAGLVLGGSIAPTEAKPAKVNQPDSTPTAAPTTKVESKLTSTSTPAPTSTPEAPTATPEVAEKLKVMESCHPGNFNFMVERYAGNVNEVTPDEIRNHVARFKRLAKDQPERLQRDRMTAQLTLLLPPDQLTKRELNYDIKDVQKGMPQTGMGFTDEDLNIMAVLDGEGVYKYDALFRKGEDGLNRGCMVLQAEYLPWALKKYAEEMVKMSGGEKSPGEVQQKVAEMTGALGISDATSDAFNRLIKFKTHETILGSKRADGQQPEQLLEVKFSVLKEGEKQILSNQHIKNSVLLATIFDEITQKWRVEVFVLSTTSDIVDSMRDVNAERELNPAHRNLNADGGRLLPKGPPPQEPAKVPTQEETKPSETQVPPKNPPKNPPRPTQPPPTERPPTQPSPTATPEQLGNPGNAKPVGKAGEKGPEFNPPPGGPGVKGKSDNPFKKPPHTP